MAAQKFSLSFSKTIEKKSLQPSVIRSDERVTIEEERKEALQSIEENVLKTDAVHTEEKELVIPLVQSDRASAFRRLAERREEMKGGEKETKGEETKKEDEERKPMTLDEQAEAALLEESKRKLDSWSERGKPPDDMTISVAPEESPLDSSAVDLGKESSLDDYNEVDISVFGKAVLRGMGWKKAEGIGRTTKRVVEIIDPTSKTFGLIGKKEAPSSSEGTPGVQEELTLAKGSFVYIHAGRHRGTYGVVESLDEDHLLVKAAMTQKVIREVEFNIRVISQKEFKDSSRVINKDMYDKFKEKEMKKEDDKKTKESSDEGRTKRQKTDKREREKREKITERNGKELISDTAQKVKEEVDKEGGKERDDDGRHRKENNSRKYEEKLDLNEKSLNNSVKKERDPAKRPRDSCQIPPEKCTKRGRVGGSGASKEARRTTKEAGRTKEEAVKASRRMPAIPWVREDLRVRLISRDYKGGRYHKQKVIVRAVETAESCECVAEDGRALGGVHPDWLETVIPKVKPQIVMIVKGDQKAQKGRILQLHRDEERASVQLLEDETVILRLHYDDICEYVR